MATTISNHTSAQSSYQCNRCGQMAAALLNGFCGTCYYGSQLQQNTTQRNIQTNPSSPWRIAMGTTYAACPNCGSGYPAGSVCHYCAIVPKAKASSGKVGNTTWKKTEVTVGKGDVLITLVDKSDIKWNVKGMSPKMVLDLINQLHKALIEIREGRNHGDPA